MGSSSASDVLAHSKCPPLTNETVCMQNLQLHSDYAHTHFISRVSSSSMGHVKKENSRHVVLVRPLAKANSQNEGL